MGKSRRIEILVLAVLILLQSAVYVFFGHRKAYLHMDEAYTFGLVQYDRVQLHENEDHYGTWHTSQYYRDYLEVSPEGRWDFSPVYLQQMRDVHPPFYYLLFRIANLGADGVSFWPGILLNILLQALVTVVFYAVLKRLFAAQSHRCEKAALTAFLSSVSLSTLSMVMFLRMYVLLSLVVLLTLLLHLRLAASEAPRKRDYVWIGIVAALGSLTHYYYLFYLFGMCVLFFVRYTRRKQPERRKAYLKTMLVAAACSLAVFPFSVVHLFFTKRGSGAIGTMFLFENHLERFVDYCNMFSRYGTNRVLYYALLLFLLLFLLYRYRDKTFRPRLREALSGDRDTVMTVLVPALVFCALSAIASPFVEIRYFSAVSALFLALLLYAIFAFLRTVGKKAISLLLVAVFSVAFLVLPIVTETYPSYLYRERAASMEKIKDYRHVPAVYVSNEPGYMILSDILLFAELDQTYLARQYTEFDAEQAREVVSDVDLSDGLLLILAYNQDERVSLNAFEDALGIEPQFFDSMDFGRIFYFDPHAEIEE